jgi:hypothetical protein
MLAGLPNTITIDQITYRSMPSLHCTLINVGNLIYLLQQKQKLAPDKAKSQAWETVNAAIMRVKPQFQGFLNDLRLVNNPSVGKLTVVAMVRVAGLRELFEEINTKLGVDLPLQPAHVTLLHYGQNFPNGIWLNNSADLKEYSRPLTEATREELTQQLDPYETFTWSRYMSPAPILNNLTLELHVPSFAPEREFYSQFGFEQIDYDPISGGGNSDLGYFEIKREDSLGRTQLNFYGDKDSVAKHAHFNEFPPDTPRGYAVEITIPVDDVEDLWERAGRRLPQEQISQPLEIKRWGKRDFRVVDPFGFYIRFTEPVDWRQDK